MKIALLGVRGQIGNHLVPYFVLKNRYDVWGPNREDFNLYDTPFVYDVICKEEPDLIINTAAYTDVDGAERYKDLADKINHQAVREIAKAAKNLDVPLIHISTDYVFDGTKEEKYTEKDKPHPLNLYGRTKLDGDDAILSIGPKGIIFRTSWIYDWRRTNFFLKMKFVMQPGARIHVIDDQFGIPNSAQILAKYVNDYVQAGKFEKMQIVNLVCDEHVSWFQFAKMICSYLRKDPWVKLIPVSTEQYLGRYAKDKIVAMRPKNAVLDNTKAKGLGFHLPKWNVVFADFIQKPHRQ
jgi:dTDP-4-dehydrorhamnose reductase